MTGEGGTPHISSEVGFPSTAGGTFKAGRPPGSQGVPPGAPETPGQPPGGAFGTMQGSGVPSVGQSVPRRAHDPLSRPYQLPSRGLYYGDKLPGGRVTIAPTRGAQEEILAGARDNPRAALPALRHVAEQCIDTGGLPFNDLILFDFTAVVMHWMALSAGVEEMTLTPTHPGCGRSFSHRLALSDLESTTLRLAQNGENPTWPPEYDDDPMAVLRELDAEANECGKDVEYVLAPEDAAEPFVTEALPHTGEVVGFRYHRVSDLVRAEEYAARSGDRQAVPGSKLHTFLMASQIVSVNGQPVSGVLEATTWVNRQPTPTLNALRDEIGLRDFGIDVSPRFRCPHCGGSFQMRLPLDGSLFRRRRRRRHRRSTE